MKTVLIILAVVTLLVGVYKLSKWLSWSKSKPGSSTSGGGSGANNTPTPIE